MLRYDLSDALLESVLFSFCDDFVKEVVVNASSIFG